MTFLLYTVVTLFIVVCVILTLLVLIQKGRGGGLASAFGGGGGGNTAFGSKTGDVLTWATAIVFGVFLLLAVAANLAFNAYSNQKRPNVVTNPGAPERQPGPPSDPAGPGLPGSSLPQAPVTADPGVANPPPAAGGGPTTR